MAAVPLTSENFVGLITPAILRQPASAQVKGLASQAKGIRFISKAALAESGSVTQGNDLALNVTLKLADIEPDPSRFKPYGSGAEGRFDIVGNLKNMTLTYDYDIGLSGLNSLNMQVSGDMAMDVKFSGGVEAQLGYYSQAWKEVEDQQATLLGMNGKFTGLDSKIKIGKFPLAGLVFSVACPRWKTKLEARRAKSGKFSMPPRRPRAGRVPEGCRALSASVGNLQGFPNRP